jgi:hypothetical protein
MYGRFALPKALKQAAQAQEKSRENNKNIAGMT